MTALRTLICIMLCFVLWTDAFGQNPALNSKWNTEYESLEGEKVKAKVTFSHSGQGQFGSGKYKTKFGDGVLSQVRRETADRKKTPGINPNGPLPGPDSPNFGATDKQAVYLKGLWDFQGTTGWFSWELYETQNGVCKFVGKWGLVENNQAGPVKGKWTGTLDTGNQNDQGSRNSNGPVINIPD